MKNLIIFDFSYALVVLQNNAVMYKSYYCGLKYCFLLYKTVNYVVLTQSQTPFAFSLLSVYLIENCAICKVSSSKRSFTAIPSKRRVIF